MLPIYRAVLISRGVGTKGTKELTMVTMVGKPPGPPGWCYTVPGVLYQVHYNRYTGGEQTPPAPDT